MNCENRFVFIGKKIGVVWRLFLWTGRGHAKCVFMGMESLLEEARLEILQKQGDDLFSDMKK